MDKRYYLIGFLILALFQLFVPGKMIYDQEKVLRKGTIIKLETAPIDPVDPFRGRYLVLRFEPSTYAVNAEEIKDGINLAKQVHLTFLEDSNGIAIINELSLDTPSHEDYLTVGVQNRGLIHSPNNYQTIRLEYPFDRFYMEETAAIKAEKIYNESLRDTNLLTYAEIAIKNGSGTIKDVYINNNSLRSLIND